MRDDADEHVHCFPTRSGRKMRPEEVLAIAVLEDAVRTLQRCAVANDRAARMLVAEIEEWFACDDTDHPFAFVSICDVLTLDVAYMRSGLRNWRESRQVALGTEARVLFPSPPGGEDEQRDGEERRREGRRHGKERREGALSRPSAASRTATP